MDVSHVTPAARMVARFGAARIAAWTSRHRTRVHAWTWPTEKGGTGGAIPLRARQPIIDGAKRDLGEVVLHADFEPQGSERYLSTEASAA